MMDYECILWNYEAPYSPRLWGVSSYKGQPVVFWGRIDEELKFQIVPGAHVYTLTTDKIDHYGYCRTSIVSLAQSGWILDIKNMLTLCIIGNELQTGLTVYGAGEDTFRPKIWSTKTNAS